MSILSDSEISELCVQPEMYYDRAAHFRWMEEPRTETLELRIGETMEQKYARFEREKQPFIKPITDEMRAAFRPMISNFEIDSIREVHVEDQLVANMLRGDGIKYGGTRKVLSYGSTSYGYDVTLAEEFQVFTNINGGEIDPKNLDKSKCLIDAPLRECPNGDKYVLLPPNSYILGWTREYFQMPRNVMAICMGKSTYARCGAIVNVTPIEPGFEGNVVIEIANATSLPMRIYANEGISQFVFFKGERPCKVSYADRAGKYQGQRGLTHAKV